MSTQALQFPKRTNVLYIEQLFPDSHIRYWQCALAECGTIYWAEINPNINAPRIVLYESYCSDECEQVDELLGKDARDRRDT
jgi:hypothetical protein